MKATIKKVMSMLLAVTLTAGIAISGTMAYLADTDSDVNVMTMGKVSIAQHEYERVVDEDGNYVKAVSKDDNKKNYDFTPDYGITEAYKLQDFTQAKMAAPAVYTNEKHQTAWDEFQQLWNQVGAPGSNDLFDDTMKNVIDKFVFVENTGNYDAYYRTIIAIETPEGTDGLIHTSFNSNERFDAIEEDGNYDGTADSGRKSYLVGYTIVDGVRYGLYNMTYNQILTPGEVSRPSLLQVFLDPETTSEDAAKFGNTWDILAVSQAVQADIADTAGEALDGVFGEITVEDHPWDGDIAEWNIFSDVNKLNEALKDGKDVIAHSSSYNVLSSDENINVDAKGATATLMGTPSGDTYHGYLGWVADEVTVSNLNVTGTGFVELGEYGNGGTKHTANNLVLTDMTSTLANGDKGFTVGITFMSFANENVLNNCVMTGAQSMGEEILPFDIGFGQNLTTSINGGEYGRIYCWSNSFGVINDAEVGYIQAAPIRGSLTIAEGTHVGTINVDYGISSQYANAARLAKIVIEDGATVDEIIYDGKTYTQTEWAEYVGSHN